METPATSFRNSTPTSANACAQQSFQPKPGGEPQGEPPGLTPLTKPQGPPGQAHVEQPGGEHQPGGEPPGLTPPTAPGVAPAEVLHSRCWREPRGGAGPEAAVTVAVAVAVVAAGAVVAAAAAAAVVAVQAVQALALKPLVQTLVPRLPYPPNALEDNS